MIMSLYESAGRAQGHTPTNVELLNFAVTPTDNPEWKGSHGGSHDTEVRKS